jgi:hypothetical protein
MLLVLDYHGFYFPFVVLEKGVIHLYTTYPNCRLREEWDTAALYSPADLFCSLHVCLPFFVDDDYSPCPLLVREFSGMDIK